MQQKYEVKHELEDIYVDGSTVDMNRLEDTFTINDIGSYDSLLVSINSISITASIAKISYEEKE